MLWVVLGEVFVVVCEVDVVGDVGVFGEFLDYVVIGGGGFVFVGVEY